jgi:putative membrane protein
VNQLLQPTPEGNPCRRMISYFVGLIQGVEGTWSRADANNLSIERTRLAYERTMMAWIRTGVSLISFGFSIYKFFQIQEIGLKGAFHEGFIGPRGFGATMILIGLSVVGIAGAQHMRDLRSLRATGIETPPSLAVVVGALVALMGFLGLIAVTFKE